MSLQLSLLLLLFREKETERKTFLCVWWRVAIEGDVEEGAMITQQSKCMICAFKPTFLGENCFSKMKNIHIHTHTWIHISLFYDLI